MLEVMKAQEVAADVAPHLGPEWSLRKEDAAGGGGILEREGSPGGGIHFSTGWGVDTGRIRISGHCDSRHVKGPAGVDHRLDAYGHGNRELGHASEITVAINRGSKIIAREINRRLLPVWREQFVAIQTNMDQYEKSLGQQANILDRLAAAAGKEPNNNGIGSPSIYLNDGDTYLTARVDSADTVRFENFSTEPAMAIAILELVRRWPLENDLGAVDFDGEGNHV